MIPDGITPEELARIEQQAVYAGFVVAVLLLGALLALWAALDAWRHHQDRKTVRAAQSRRQAAQQAGIQAGVDVGWHDASKPTQNSPQPAQEHTP